MPAFLAALPAIAAVVSSGINAISNARQTKKTNEANMKLAKYQYTMNSPANQMKQYSEAGLNPNLIYGSGSGAAAKYDAPTVDYRRPGFDMPNMISMYQDIKLKQEQIQQMAAQTASIQQRTINDKLKSVVIDADGKIRVGKQASEIMKAQSDAYAAEWRGKYLYNVVNDIQPLQSRNLVKQGDLLGEQITSQQLDNVFKKYQNVWMSMGVRPGDHIALRMAIQVLQAAGVDVQNWFK